LISAQSVCGTGTPKVYTDVPTGAPLTVDGNVSDWQAALIGSFSGNIDNPYINPHYPNNIQIDKLKAESDLDAGDISNNSRDLRFFAFTYDLKNVYFYFRRPSSNNSQISVYYYVDINADGYMRNGEPVIKVDVSGSNAAPSIMYYVENTSAAGWISGIGNSMVDPVTGNADGYDMPGSLESVASSSLPSLDAAGGEKYAGAQTETGFGWEFVIPFNYLRLYGGYTGITPMNYKRIFTWHVALDAGNSLSNGADDNAGGCCSGVAVSSPAVIEAGDPVTTFLGTYSGDTKYKTNVNFSEEGGAATKISLSQVKFYNFTPSGNGVNPTQFSVIVSKDVNNDQIADANSSITYVYDAGLSNPSLNEYVYITPSAPVQIQVVQNGDANFLIEVDLKTPGIKTLDMEIQSTNEIVNTSTSTCSTENTSNTTEEIAYVVTPLPVTFSNFHASRNKSSVALKWETASEQNNRGFNVQRNTKGVWESVAFVFSAADGGNSSSLLSYSYNDVNNEKGVSQYRIQQVDMDNKASYSVIRSVKGEGQANKAVVYPNPATEGKVNVVFEDQGAKAVTVSDISGRIVRQYRSVVNSLVIDGLESGMYTIQITDLSSAVSTTEKVIIKKR
jgi:hypothetical protein